MSCPNIMCKDPRYSKYRVGKWTIGEPKIEDIWCNSSTLEIGSWCSIARGVTIWLGGDHNTQWVTTASINHFLGYDLTKHGRGTYLCPRPADGPTVIGSDVWIGCEAKIMQNVKIGHGAVIGAYSVVTHDVPPYAIVAGVPARVVKMRFDDATIKALLEISWWQWDDEKTKQAVPYLQSNRISEFIEKYKKEIV